jgi:hypothetical protein
MATHILMSIVQTSVDQVTMKFRQKLMFIYRHNNIVVTKDTKIK